MNYLNLIMISFLIINLSIIFFVIINERRPPEKSLIWILTLIFFGPIGFIFYLFLGKDIQRPYLKNNLLYKLHLFDYSSNESVIELIPKNNDYDEIIQTIDLVSKINVFPITKYSKIEIFSNGIQKFDSLKNELNAAKHHIHMEYFIVRDDHIGNEIKNILIRKSNEGVKVRFILDKIGCHKLSKKYINDLKQNGIKVLFYSYMSTPFLKLINTQINYRNHRKIVIIDGITSFTGGINIGDEYLGRSSIGNWRDTHLMIKGECSLAIQDVFIDDYTNLMKLKDKNYSKDDITNDISNYFPKPKENNILLTQIIRSGPNLSKDNMILPIIKLISIAKKNIRICTPYFIPSAGFLDILKISILSGVEISIIFPGKPDHKLVYYASKTYLRELSNIGCKVYFYDKNSFIHSKFIIVDDYIVTVGSTNMDIRSFELNYEMNLIIYDHNICDKFISIFEEDIKNSTLANIESFENISIYQKFYENISRLFSSLL
ncbi:cardiolipin synthase [Candidatus Arthromitus sp. SFB-rat-Yit]|uniref:cardiolipin synthase n=1 Tax=Candidatus Arthromitus sp. SFB-rat-Yit TaxID=1041504 RepID=UPI000227A7BF|nr:cardiolipin synthase [Candidatus Arthromitus sp. SFB-rat-Yit]BAK80684.1 cardiolipin synthetase [Candidatus Arthromitus sp. SFB-rat-Yit]